ncbi:hypothetical protein MLD38_009700 [Melastoma candidum]|uniref:Uncharacterized protein n=1 Tax=Melastoma candidum TaxID=119954 RepID=A0ACB9RYY4_9MYRT|nr:hypothetical protein MLD38_009700 [Melastoma candidum]
MRTLTRQQLLSIKLPKRQGVTISKGHKNYELMLNLQLGIRHSVGRPGPAISLDLKPSVFDPKEEVWTRFPSEGSKQTPPHQSCEFNWKDYCPVVFRTLRKLFKVNAADYMISICGNDALRELSSPGKSGSFFFLTNDDRYMIKTMKKSEVKVSQSGDLTMAEPLGSTVGTPSGINDTGGESEEMDSITCETMSGADAALGINMPALAELTIYDKTTISARNWNMHTSPFKYDSTSISAVDPKQYSRRFRDFIFRIFVEDNLG